MYLNRIEVPERLRFLPMSFRRHKTFWVEYKELVELREAFQRYKEDCMFVWLDSKDKPIRPVELRYKLDYFKKIRLIRTSYEDERGHTRMWERGKIGIGCYKVELEYIQLPQRYYRGRKGQ